MHAERDIVVPFLSLGLSVGPMPILCRNNCTYRKTFSTTWRGDYSIFSATAITKSKENHVWKSVMHMGWENSDFRLKTLFISETVRDSPGLLWITNRKSYAAHRFVSVPVISKTGVRECIVLLRCPGSYSHLSRPLSRVFLVFDRLAHFSADFLLAAFPADFRQAIIFRRRRPNSATDGV